MAWPSIIVGVAGVSGLDVGGGGRRGGGRRSREVAAV